MAEMSHPEAEGQGLTQASDSDPFVASAKKGELSIGRSSSASPSHKASDERGKATEDKPVYEVGFHVVSTVDEVGVGAVVEKIRAELAKGKAEIINEQFPTKMTFAYVIERSRSGKREKYTEGYFGWIKFASEPNVIAPLAHLLQHTTEVLRYLIVETVREDAPVRRAVYTSDRLEGETIQKPTSAPEKGGDVSEEELEKSIEALVSQ